MFPSKLGERSFELEEVSGVETEVRFANMDRVGSNEGSVDCENGAWQSEECEGGGFDEASWKART